MWENSSDHSVEYFNLTVGDNEFVLKGTVVLLLDQMPACITYRVECDKNWKTRGAVIHQERAGDIKRLALTVNEEQMWQTEESTIPFAAGLYDVDLEITPATNTLPIRRINLKDGESQQVDAVWIRFPSLAVERLHQRYTRIDHRLYKYEKPSNGYEAQLEVDEFGVVISYDDVWYRVGA